MRITKIVPGIAALIVIATGLRRFVVQEVLEECSTVCPPI
jgi:hypothetical protein